MQRRPWLRLSVAVLWWIRELGSGGFSGEKDKCTYLLSKMFGGRVWYTAVKTRQPWGAGMGGMTLCLALALLSCAVELAH